MKTLERLGVSAIIIEDKIGLKKNSFSVLKSNNNKILLKTFLKIKTAIQSRVTNDFMVIARIESLILEIGMDDALLRAKKYIEASVDGIMIHSRRESPDEIFEFCDQ